MKRKSFVFFASNNGSAMRIIQRDIIAKKLNGKISLLVTNRPSAPALDFARHHHIPTFIFDGDDEALIQRLDEAQADVIMLSGYLKVISRKILEHASAPFINIHPSLLPDFGGKGMFGMNVHRAVIEAKAAFSGATLHFVNEHYDQGDIIAQTRVKLSPHETAQSLSDKIVKEEARLVSAIFQKIDGADDVTQFFAQKMKKAQKAQTLNAA